MWHSCAFSWATEAFSDQSPSCFQAECFATACCFEAHLACFMSYCCFFFSDSSSLDVSNYFLRGGGRCFSAMQTLASMAALPDIKQERCQCTLFWLSLGWFHSVSLSGLSICLSLFSLRCVLRPALLCTVYDPPFPLAPLPSLSLAFLRTRLIAGSELYIQVNSWDGWPLLNVYVLCLYCIRRLLSTFWMQALLHPLGPSKLVRVNFEALCVELYWSYWHFVAFRWQRAALDARIKHGKSFVFADMKHIQHLPSSNLQRLRIRCWVVKDLFSCIYHCCRYGLR